MPVTSQHALIRRSIDKVWNEGDIELADELFTDDYVNHGGLIPDLLVGPEMIKLSVVIYRRAFPSLHISVNELRTHRGIVTLSWTAREERQRDTCYATGVSAATTHVTGTLRIRCADGKIAESWVAWERGSSRGVWPIAPSIPRCSQSEGAHALLGEPWSASLYERSGRERGRR